MEPAIQYARSADGVRIAYWALNEGPALVVMPNTPFTHIQLEWEIPEVRDWYQRLMAGHRLVRYDPRGFGLSDRDVDDFSLGAQIADLEAVIDKLGLDRFVLLGSADSGIVAIAHAARFPERVSHLILWCSWASRSDVSGTPQTRSLRALIEQDWQIYTETAARVILGWGNEALARDFAAFYRECTTPEVLRNLVPAVYQWDVKDLLPEITCPVLVLHRRGMPTVDVQVATGLAAGFPNARLVLLDGVSPLPWIGDMPAALRAVHDFLGDDVGPAILERLPARSSVTILFTDIEASTALTTRLGDERAQELLHDHNRIVRDALRRHAGSEIKHTGDGIMASFTSAADALECAIDIQEAVASRNDASETPFGVHIGLNSGEPVAEERDLFGTSVQLAARACEHAATGQILATNVVRELAAGKGFLFSQQEDVVLRGFEDPVRLFEVRW